MKTLEEIQKVSEGMLNIAKETLKTDGELMPMAMGFAGDEVLMIAIADVDKDRMAFRAVEKILREHKAEAVCLINDGFSKVFPEKDFPEKNYKIGDLSKDYQAKECIIAAIKGKTIAPTVKMQTYTRNEVGDIVFDEPTSWTEGGINLIGDWWISFFDSMPEELVDMFRHFKMAGLPSTVFSKHARNAFKKMGKTDNEIPLDQEMQEWFKSL